MHMTGLEPLHAPLMQVSVSVHALPSLQLVLLMQAHPPFGVPSQLSSFP
jgi:hypothetical protein